MLAQTTIYVLQQTPAPAEEEQLVLVIITVTDLAVVSGNMNKTFLKRRTFNFYSL